MLRLLDVTNLTVAQLLISGLVVPLWVELPDFGKKFAPSIFSNF